MTANRTTTPEHCESCGCTLSEGEVDRCDGCHYTHEEIAEEDAAAPPCCPVCNGLGDHLGRLGTLDHFRCRSCGCTFHITEKTDDE